MVYSPCSIEVLEPFYGADSAADSDRWSDGEIGHCERCNSDFDIDVVNGTEGMLIQVDSGNEGTIEYKIVKEYEEPEEEY